MKRKNFKKNAIYHIFNKSIANFNIFREQKNCIRFIQALAYYNKDNIKKINLGKYLKTNQEFNPTLLFPEKETIVKFISFCIMPDHYHLLIKILKDDVFSKYISNVENSYSRFFNLKHNRKGPLWQGRFKAVRIKNNEQLLHVSRYIHLNPTTNNLVAKPDEWDFSSYRLIIENSIFLEEIITEISIKDTITYKNFVENQIDYQKKLKIIKKLIFD